MRKLYFLAFSFLCITTASAQIITFTDSRLKNKLIGASVSNDTAKDINGNPMVIDVNGNSEIEVSEALNVYDLNVGANALAQAIFNTVGLEYFTNLRKLNVRLLYNNTFNATVFPLLEELDCSNSTQMQTLNVTGLVHLKKFNCSSILNLASTLDLSSLTALEYLDCSWNNLTMLNITGLTNLVEVMADENYIPSLNLTGMVHLKKLYLYNNRMISLNASGLTQLEDLRFTLNPVTTLNLTNTPALKRLDCSYTDITSLNVTANSNLEILNCQGIGVTSLNLSGLQHLTNVDCSNSEIPGTFQPSLTSINLSGCVALTELKCDYNKIASLNLSGLTALTYLYCDNNLLTTLNVSPATNLETLDCSKNPFTTIDLTQNTALLNFYCEHSQLVTADLSPLIALRNLDLSYSANLKNLLIKNGMNPFAISGYVIDQTPNLAYLCADEQFFYYYQQILTNSQHSNVELNTYCNFVPGGVYYSLNGIASYDETNNGCDASDPKVPHMRFNVGNGSQAVNILSNANGQVMIPVQAGAQTFRANVENTAYFSVSPTTANVNFPTTTSPFTQPFCLTANGNFPDLEIMMMPLDIARPGFDAKYKLVCRNKGTSTQSGNITLTLNDAVLDLVSATPVVSSQASNNLTWNFTNLKPFQTLEIAFVLNVNSPMETPAVNGGDLLDYNVVVTGSAADTTAEDNAFTYVQTVVNSFDPNDKTCLEGNTITPEMVGKYVHYMIRFENTGTFAAENIVVKDMIDTNKFDVASLLPLSGSHPFVTKVSATNKVEFIFENINLPFADANNDGYVAFKIKTKPTLVLGDTFSNTASIYFDYNFPIVTDPAVTTVALLANSDFEFGDYFKIYPNPVAAILNIEMKKNIEITSVNIYNTLGQLVLVIPNAQQTKSVDVSSLKTGNYFLKINSGQGSSSVKFVKM